MFSVFDCHCDTVTTAIARDEDIYDNSLQLSLKRLTEFKRAFQIFAIWLDDEYVEKGFLNTIKAIDFFDDCLVKHSDIAEKITENRQIEKCKKIGAILSIEGGEAIGEDIDNIDILYNKGIRLCTLTWNRENRLGYGAETGSDKPLKPFGIEALKRMESLKMIVDVSHLNRTGFLSVCEHSTRPFMATHSNAYALCGHYRNLTDDQLRMIGQTGSMVGINLYPPFLNESGQADINDILRHTEYMADILGDDKLCLGCDFDGIDYTPKGIDGVEDLYIIYEAFCNSFGKITADRIFFDNMYDFAKKML